MSVPVDNIFKLHHSMWSGIRDKGVLVTVNMLNLYNNRTELMLFK